MRDNNHETRGREHRVETECLPDNHRTCISDCMRPGRAEQHIPSHT